MLGQGTSCLCVKVCLCIGSDICKVSRVFAAYIGICSARFVCHASYQAIDVSIGKRVHMGMMNVCLSHDTAFRWLVRNRNPRIAGRASTARVLPLSSPSMVQCRVLASELRLGVDPLEVLVCRSSGRRDSGSVKAHLSGLAYPSGSFVRVNVPGLGGVYAASPELVFRQIAAKHSLLEAVYVGYALCSSYRVDGQVDGGIAIREGDDAPLTTVSRIGAYLRKTEGSYGCAKARRALSYVREGSASPTESALAMGLSLPACLGGFGAGDVVLQRSAENGDLASSGLAGVSTRSSVAIEMKESGCGRGPVSMVVLDACDDNAQKGNGCAGGRKRAIRACMAVTPSQVYEFGSYVQLCERVCRQLDTRGGSRRRITEQEAGRREAIRARQAELWRTLVCFSEFRQAETGDCVNVFELPSVRDGR